MSDMQVGETSGYFRVARAGLVVVAAFFVLNFGYWSAVYDGFDRGYSHARTHPAIVAEEEDARSKGIRLSEGQRSYELLSGEYGRLFYTALLMLAVALMRFVVPIRAITNSLSIISILGAVSILLSLLYYLSLKDPEQNLGARSPFNAFAVESANFDVASAILAVVWIVIDALIILSFLWRGKRTIPSAAAAATPPL